jgi:hypothetical protein
MMQCRVKYIFTLLIILASQIMINAQIQSSTSSFHKLIKLDTSWTRINIENVVKKIQGLNAIRASVELDVIKDANDLILVRTQSQNRCLFHIEFHGKEKPVYLLLANGNLMKDTINSGYVDSTKIQFTLQRYADDKLYINCQTVPDEVYVLWNDSPIPFRRMGRYIHIYLPNYVEKPAESVIRIYASKSHKIAGEFLVHLKNGKPENLRESTTGLKWLGTKNIGTQNIDNHIAVPVHQVIEDIRISQSDSLSRVDELTEVEGSKSLLPSWINLYIDSYYSRFSDSAGTNNFHALAALSPRHNVIGLNTIQLGIQFQNDNIRAKGVFHFGDFPKTSWSEEFNQIMEANIGFRLSNSLWLDAGFFRSYIGTEGLLPRENICSSISVCTFFEPAQSSGLRLRYLPNASWLFDFYLLNAYNGFEDNNTKKSIGFLINYNINESLSFGLSNYLGDDTPKQSDSLSHLRYYQNVYFNFSRHKWQIQLGANQGIQDNSDLNTSSKIAYMLSSLLSLKYNVATHFSFYGRYEWFYDPDAILSVQITDSNNNKSGYKLWGATLGFEIKPMEQSFIRFEGRILNFYKSQNVFYRDGVFRNNRSEFMLNMGVSF